MDGYLDDIIARSNLLKSQLEDSDHHSLLLKFICQNFKNFLQVVIKQTCGTYISMRGVCGLLLTLAAISNGQLGQEKHTYPAHIVWPAPRHMQIAHTKTVSPSLL